MPKSFPRAVSKAMRFVLANIGSGEFNSSTFLPSIKELAVRAQVSLFTMWKATKSLKEMGILDGVHGRRFLPVKNIEDRLPDLEDDLIETSSPTPQSSSSVWLRAEKALKKDIFNGRYTPGQAMASLKELQSTYNVSFRTLKKALDSLAAEGLIVPYKRTFSVKSFTAKKSRLKIIPIIPGNKAHRIFLVSLNQAFFRSLEIECIKSNIGMEPVSYYLQDEKLVYYNQEGDICRLPDNDTILGYLHLVPSLAEGRDNVFAQLSHIDKPVAVLDVVGGWRMPRFMKKPLVQMFSAAVSPKASSHVARYLIGKGHKNIAYVSPFHNALWSRNRFSGLVKTYEDSGVDGSVQLFCLENPSQIADFYREQALKESNIDELFKDYDKWKKSVPEFYGKYIDYYLNNIKNEKVSSALFFHHIEKLFKQVLECKEITAWVCSNDVVGNAAVRFFHNHEKTIPQHIALVSFDNTVGALNSGLTSYDFNLSAAAQNIIGYLSNTASLSLTKGRKPFEADGYVIERMSSR